MVSWITLKVHCKMQVRRLVDDTHVLPLVALSSVEISHKGLNFKMIFFHKKETAVGAISWFIFSNKYCIIKLSFSRDSILKREFKISFPIYYYNRCKNMYQKSWFNIRFVIWNRIRKIIPIRNLPSRIRLMIPVSEWYSLRSGFHLKKMNFSDKNEKLI